MGGESLPRIRDFADVDYNPFTAARELGGEGAVTDVHPEFHRLRAESPVFDGDLRVHFGLAPDLTTKHLRQVAVLGHEVGKAILNDTDNWSNSVYVNSIGVFFGRSITTMDNPEHAIYRRMFQQSFGPGMIKQWKDGMIPRVIDAVIDTFEERGHAELVSEFTLNFPFHFIHELLDLPPVDRQVFHRLAFGQLLVTFDKARGDEAIANLQHYLEMVVANRRAAPREDDLMSMIANAEIDGEPVPDSVVFGFFRQLMNAAGDTSYNGFSTVLAGLLMHPDQLETLRQDRSLIPKAIEEGLRWNPPVMLLSRTPKQPLEVCGVKIEPGDHVGVVLPALNRDPAMFDRPDEFDISRGTRGHSAFGLGPHICLGQHLARAEMEIALSLLLDRFPKLRADDAYPAPEVGGFMLRGPASLRVRFD
ncbi:MAG: cytochrome P450 [Sphingomonadaceae bacterium]|nr:cytochrome P450 [Sphingomonadaceae bacterium]